jgi:hypothetical protein
VSGRWFRSAQDSSSDSLKIPALFLTFASLIEAYATVFAAGLPAQSHGEWPAQTLVCFLLIALLGIAWWVVARPLLRPGTSRMTPPLARLAFLLPAYALCQLVPLPLTLVRMLSPARAQLADSPSPLPPHAWVPLSAAPSATFFHCLLFTACAILFLVVFDLSRNFSLRPWITIAPLIVVAAVEAILGLLQVAANPDGIATGTWLNRNHYAVFLEMILPFPALFPFAVFAGRRTRTRNPGNPANIASALLPFLGLFISALLLAAIVASLSRMGFVAPLASLVFVAIIALARGRSPRRTRLLAVAVMLAAIALLLLMPQSQTPTPDLSLDRQNSLPRISAFPVFGIGLGWYDANRTGGSAFSHSPALDGYLQYLAEMGVLGVALALVPLSFVLAGLRAGIHHIRPEIRWLSLACAGSMVAAAVHGFPDSGLYVPANMFALAWILGLAAFLGAWSSRNEGLFFEPTVIVLPPPRSASPILPARSRTKPAHPDYTEP